MRKKKICVKEIDRQIQCLVENNLAYTNSFQDQLDRKQNVKD